MNRYNLVSRATIVSLCLLSLFIIIVLSEYKILKNTNEKLQRKLSLSSIIENRKSNVFTYKDHLQGINERYYEVPIRRAILSTAQHKDDEIKWENIVIMILTHNNNDSHELVQAQFHTWINRLGDEGIGLDIVFVTDKWDIRSKEQILPDANKVKPTIHLYKSSSAHYNMGKKCRAKVLDGFIHIIEMFKINNNKHYFLKMDPDNFLLAENLIKYVNVLHKMHPNPVDFGRHICAGTGDFCFSEGGLYGMDRLGLLLTLNYIKTHDPDVYRYNDNGKDSIEHEDFFMSYAFFKALGYSAVEGTPIIYPRDIESCDPHAISIHPIKSAANIYDYARFCYDENGNIKKGVDLRVAY